MALNADAEKQKEVEAIGLPLMEIDLSDLYGTTFDRETMRTAVLWQEDNRSRIYNSKTEEAITWAEKIYGELAGKQKQVYTRREQKRQRKKELQRKNQETSQGILKELFQPEVYRKRLADLRSDAPADQVARSCAFYAKCIDGFPFFLDIPITGEMIFPCDRRIWQSRVIDRFVYNRTDHSTVHVKKIQEWLRKYQEEIPIDWAIASRASIETLKVTNRSWIHSDTAGSVVPSAERFSAKTT